MKSSVLSVGTELLFGQVINTNAAFLSKELNDLGIDVMSHYTVGDNPGCLKEMILRIFQDCDLILTTGGLGPTQDDLTKEIACEAMEDTLVLHENIKEDLEKFFLKLGRTITENNYKQAYFPSRAVIFENGAGTAPGFALENNGKTIICLPGPPREMKGMFQHQVKPFLQKRTDAAIYYKMLRLFGIGESQLETELIELIDGQKDPTIATYAKEGECCVRVTSKRKDPEEARQAVHEMIGKIEEKVGNYIFSYDDEELHQVVAKKLLKEGISVSCAESCTGGLFSQTLTDVSGISAIFDRGLVTYSNKAKIEELGVSPKTLETFGAVSEETAREMAEGLKKKTGSRLCISITGIAGPEGGSADKPVGLVYFCAILDEKKVCRGVKIRDLGRAWNRNYAKLLMFDAVNKLIEEKKYL